MSSTMLNKPFRKNLYNSAIDEEIKETDEYEAEDFESSFTNQDLKEKKS